jgi:hypothetical protein
MGNNQSNSYNRVSQFLSTTLNQSVHQDQQCGSTNQNSINIGVDGAKSFNFSNNRISQNIKSQLNCLAKQSSEQKLDNKLMSTIRQQAEATTAGLTASFGNAANSTNITELAVQTAISQIATLQQKCINSATNKFNIDLKNIDGAVNITDNVIEQTIDAMIDCTQEAKSTQDLKNDLTLAIKQSAKSKNENAMQFLTDMLNALMNPMILFLILGIFIIFYLVSSASRGVSTLRGIFTNGKFWIIVGFMLAIYFGITAAIIFTKSDAAEDIWPFHSLLKGFSHEDSKEYRVRGEYNTRQLIVSFSVCGVIILVGIIMEVYHHYSKPKASKTTTESDHRDPVMVMSKIESTEVKESEE